MTPPADVALETLTRAADHGDAGAMTALGSRLLVGADAPIDRQAAVGRLMAAAEQGETAALSLLATLAAAGVVARPDWNAAMAWLRRAAELGSEEARTQLALLATGTPAVPPDDGDDDIWRRLAGGVDVAAWIAAPPRRPLCETPRVRMADGFVTPQVCDWLRRKAQGRMRPAMMYQLATKTTRLDPHRTCSDYEFDILNSDLVLLLVRERIAALTRLPTIAMEPPRVFHYALGEQIKPHFDRCGDEVGGYGLGSGYGGDRIVTFLLYLNDDFEGGELDFPRVGFRCRGVKGDAVYFAHVDMAGKPDPLSLHAGLAITRGEKWLFSQWIHDRPFGIPDRRAA